MRNSLSEAIRDLVDNAEEPVTFSEVKEMLGRRSSVPSNRSSLPNVPRGPLRIVLIGVAATSLGVGLLFGLSGPGQGGINAEAAERLNNIASVAANLTIPQPGPHQWLHTTAHVVFSVGAESPDKGFRLIANVSALTGVWSNHESTCAQGIFGNLSFVSPDMEAAWVSSGLSPTPLHPQPTGECSLNGGALNQSTDTTANGIANGLGTVDVATLPRDPATLASVLENGDSGNPLLDHSILQQVSNPGFERALILLVIPTSGNSGEFQASLFKAMSHMPDVNSLGPMKTTSGLTGLGFSSGSEQNPPTVVLSATTGGLLEARNIGFDSLYWAIGQSQFWNPDAQTRPGGIDVSTLQIRIRTFDPAGGPELVDSAPAYGFAF